MNVALAHHWLVTMRGGEKVLEEFCQLFPDAPIYTLLWKREATNAVIEAHPIKQSALSWIPSATRHYRSFLPLFPTALRALHIPDSTQLIISSDASIIKGLSY